MVLRDSNSYRYGSVNDLEMGRRAVGWICVSYSRGGCADKKTI